MNPAIIARLNALKERNKNWNSYGADPVNPKAIERARHLLAVLKTEPLIFPTVDGGVVMSWGDEDVTLTIHADSCDLGVEGVDE